MKNQAAIMTDVRKIEIRDIDMPVIGDDEVGIEIKSVGICGSDMHFFEGKAFHIFPDSLPFVLGHECAGVIYATGKNVKNVSVGDCVAVEPGVPCGKCEFCQAGKYNLCPNVVFLATPPHEGALKRYISFPAFKVFNLPDNMSAIEGALIEPLSVGIHAVTEGGVKPGDTVAILGSGCIGLCTLLAAKAWGASRIIVTDIFNNRLEKALELGADFVINSKDADPIEKVKELTGGRGADIVFETAGSPVTAAQTSYIVCRGGTIVVVGNIFGDVPFSFRNMYIKEAQLKSVFRYRNTYPVAIQAVSSGRIPVKNIVSAQFDFEHSQEAFELAVDDKQNCVKAIININ